MKKLLFMLIALLTSVGVWAFEVNGIQYTVVSAEDKTVQVSGYNSSYEGDLEINGTVAYNETEYKVVSIKNSSFLYCSKTITVGDLPYCTSIEMNAFLNCTSLTSVGDLSACTSIGSNAFKGCKNLSTISLPSTLTAIGESAFEGCSLLKSIKLDYYLNEDISKVMFQAIPEGEKVEQGTIVCLA